MSYGFVAFDKDTLMMGSDSAISVTDSGVPFRISNDGKKIWVIDDMIIFCSGDVDLAKIIMDDFEEKKNRTVATLKDSITYWFNKYYKNRPHAKEKIDNGDIANLTLVAKFENGSPILYEMKQDNDFEVNRIVATGRQQGFYSCGVNEKMGTPIFKKHLKSKGDILSAYKHTYADMSEERIGGTLKVYGLSKNGIRLFLDEKIKENEFKWYTNPHNAHAYDNTEYIKGVLTREAQIEGSSLTLHDGNGVMKMFPKIGFWAGENAENFEDAAFSVDMLGRATMRDLVIKGSDGKVMLETRGNKIWFNNMDLEGIGRLLAEMLQVNTILADKSYVNDLTVNKLKTLPKDVEIGAYVDYIEIQDNYIHFNTAKVNDKQHAKDSRDRLLYWQDASKKVLTAENTGIIAYAYTFLPSDIKSKQVFTFEGSGDQATIKNTKGIGDGATETSGKLIESKYNGGYKTSYGASNSGKIRSVDLKDSGIFIISEDGIFTAQSKDFNFIVEQGTYKVGLTNGSKFEMSPSGVNMDIKGDINIKATGTITINGQQIKLN